MLSSIKTLSLPLAKFYYYTLYTLQFLMTKDSLKYSKYMCQTVKVLLRCLNLNFNVILHIS